MKRVLFYLYIQAYITFKAGTDIAFLWGALLVKHRVVENNCDNINQKKLFCNSTGSVLTSEYNF